MTRLDSVRLRLACAFVLGAAMPWAFAPYALRWLGVLALSGLVLLLRTTPPFRAGLFFGLGWFGVGAWWLAPTFHHYGHLPWWLASVCVGLVGLSLAWIPALGCWLAVRCAGRGTGLLLGFPLAAVCMEWLRGHVFTGLPWTALGNLVLDTPFAGWVSSFGVYGASLLPALAASAFALIIGRETRKLGVLALGVLALLGVLAPRPGIADGPGRQVRLVQPNIPQDVKWDASFLDATMRRLARLSEGKPVDLVVWPEAAVPFLLEQAPGWRNWLARLSRTLQAPIAFGGLHALGGGKAQNGVFLVDPETAGLSFAGKRHLVPFGEYVPAWAPFVHTLVPEIADFVPARDPPLLVAGDQRIGVLVCYESIFPEEARSRVLAGANVLVNVTNDAWYGTSPAAWQHLEAARMRALETGRFVLRAANTGVTAIIAPDGRILRQLPWWTEGTLAGTYRLQETGTGYLAWGDAPLFVAPLMLGALALVRWRRR